MENVICNPYLFFDGNCREAMKFYQGIFGGELNMQTYGEVDNSCPDALMDSVMHARLTGGDILLMGSDDPQSQTLGIGKVRLALGGSNEEKLRRIFEALGTDGKVNVPLARQIWGDIYGDLQDKYGIQWMVNITSSNQG